MNGPSEAFGFPVIDLPATASASKEAAVQFLVDQLVQSGQLATQHAATVYTRIFERESAGPTSIGNGIAIPHCKSDGVARVAGIVGRAADPVPWAGRLDRQPVRWIFLLVTPKSEPGMMLRELEALSRRLRGG